MNKALTYHCQQLQPLSDRIWRLHLTPDDKAISFKAGQYIELGLPDGDFKPFSIANAPLAGHTLELHICHTHDNPFTVKLLAYLATSDKVFIRGPFGDAIYPPHDDRPLLLLAGGTGFAPIKAIIEQALAHGDSRPMHLFWAARAVNEHYDHELVSHWAQCVPQFQYTPVLPSDATPADWLFATGLLDEAVIKQYPDVSQHCIYAFGPFPLIWHLQKQLATHGLAPHQFLSDATQVDDTDDGKEGEK